MEIEPVREGRDLEIWTYRCTEPACREIPQRGVGQGFATYPRIRERVETHCERYGCHFENVKIRRIGDDDLYGRD